jgi:hypothetical protein
MPGKASWNGRWSGEDKNYLAYRRLRVPTLERLGLELGATGKAWHHQWNDGWCARIHARILAENERPRKSDGFCGYEWMVDNILVYGDTEKPQAVPA